MCIAEEAYWAMVERREEIYYTFLSDWVERINFGWSKFKSSVYQEGSDFGIWWVGAITCTYLIVMLLKFTIGMLVVMLSRTWSFIFGTKDIGGAKLNLLGQDHQLAKTRARISPHSGENGIGYFNRCVVDEELSQRVQKLSEQALAKREEELSQQVLTKRELNKDFTDCQTPQLISSQKMETKVEEPAHVGMPSVKKTKG